LASPHAPVPRAPPLGSARLRGGTQGEGGAEVGTPTTPHPPLPLVKAVANIFAWYHEKTNVKKRRLKQNDRTA